VNRDNKLDNLKTGEEKLKVRVMEGEFKKSMWEMER
jgi:hypothetical protein